MTPWLLALFVAGVMGAASAVNSRLTEVLAWKTISFRLGGNNRSTLDTERLESKNVMAIGVERWEDKLFITTPRMKDGVPATLSYIRLSQLKVSKSPDLIPYPSLEANTWDPKAWPPRLNSVWRVRVDACDRLWVVDNGKVNSTKKEKSIVAKPKIVVYDLKSDELLFSYTLKDSNERTHFPAITVDVTSANCDHAFAYLPDPANNILAVYNMRTNSSHALTHNYFHFDPLAGDFHYSGFSWQWQDGGIYTLALSPVDREGNRIVYFHALASNTEFITTTKQLQNTNQTHEQRINSFKVLGGRGPNSQSSVSFLDEEIGVIFFTLINRHAVGCWNSFKSKEYTTSTLGIVAEDEDTLNWPSDVKVDKQGNLWVLTSSMADIIFGSFDANIINYRVFTAPIRQAIKGTVCDDI